jgi:hypothetical protein
MQTNSDNAIKLMDGEQLILRGLNEKRIPTYIPNTREESENDNPEDYTDVIKGNSNNPVVIRSNYPISGAHESISTVIDEYTDSYGNQIANDFMISVSCEQPLGLHTHTKSPVYDEDNNTTGEYEYIYDHIDTSVVNLHNFGDHLTNIHFNKYKTPADYIEFNLNIPEDSYGLIMMYYAKSNDTNNTDGAYLTASNNLKIFNNMIDGLES